MEWAALIAWLLTAGGGFVLLAIWLARGGMQQQREAGSRIRPPLILSHFLLAATGLVLWIIYVATDSSALAWVAFAALVVVAALGWTMFGIWARQRQRGRAGPADTAAPGSPAAGSAGSGPNPPPEQHFPVAIVGVHGLAAVTTVVLVSPAAVGVGE